MSPRVHESPSIVLRHCGRIDPGDMEQYIGAGGYQGLRRAVLMPPESVIEELARAGVRGRRGAPLAEALRACAAAPAHRLEATAGAGRPTMVVCNSAGSEPAGVDRMLLESDPHAVLEGLVIAAYAAGAGRACVVLNNRHPLAVQTVKAASEQMKARSFAGPAILGSAFGVDIEVMDVPPVSVLGEDVAVMRALCGGRPVPHPHPSWSGGTAIEAGGWAVASAETLAHVSAILEKGADWYTSLASGGGPGTRCFTVAGAVARPGVVEVRAGTTLREIVEGAGGGAAGAADIKAVQVGGLTGGWLPAHSLDVPADHDHLAAAGCTAGAGSLVVVGAGACALDLVRAALSLIEHESCGLCVVCREGTMQMAEILSDMAAGRARTHDLDLLADLARTLASTGPCSWGRSAADPVLTTLEYFRDELEAHAHRKVCPAGVCAMDGGAS